MQQPSEDGGGLSPQDTRRAIQGFNSSCCSRGTLGSEVGHCNRAAAEFSCMLLVHGSSSRRGGAHLNEDRLSVASWPVAAPFDDCSSSSRSSSNSGGSRLFRQQNANEESDSPLPAVSAYAVSVNSNGSSSSSNSIITDTGLTEALFQQQQTKEQEQQNQQQQHKWVDSASSFLSLSSSSLCVDSSPQGLLLDDTLPIPGGQLLLPSLCPAAETSPTAAASAARAVPDVVSRPLRLCVRRPGLPAAYFSLDALEQQQRTKRQEELLQRGAATVNCDRASRMRSRECQRIVEQTTAAAAAAIAAAAKPARNTAADGQQVLPVDAALAALVQGRACPLDRQRQQQQRRLCHAAAPCEGWGVSVCAAPCSCSLPVSASASSGCSQQQIAKTSAVTAAREQKRQQQQQQQQQRQEPQEGCLRCCSFLLSVFDGHDSDIAAEFASQALPLLAAKFLPQQIALGEEQQAAAAAAAAFAALDDLFRKRCRVIQRVSGAACTSGCCALSAFVQGSHLFVFNLGDCRCAFLALGDLEKLSEPVHAAQQQQHQQQQQQLDCSGCLTATLPHSCNNSTSRCSRSSNKPSFVSQRRPMRAVCRASPSLRAALKRAGAEAASVAMSSEDTPAAAFPFDQRPYTPLLPPPDATFPLPVSHEHFLNSAAADIPDAQQQEQQHGKVSAARDSSQCGWNSSNSTICSTRRASFAAQSSSCHCDPDSIPGCGECAARSLAPRPLQGSSSSQKTEKAGITFHWLSRDLRASAPYEVQRLRSLNATVEGGRLGGVLEPSRSVGDFDIKDSQPKGALSSTPETAYLKLTGPGLLLLASDGFWDFVGPEEIIKCLQQIQGVWRPLVKAARQFLMQQQRREQATSISAAGKPEVQHAFAANGTNCELEGGNHDLNPDREGGSLHFPTAAALSRLSDRLLRRAKRLGSEDDTTCLVAFIKPIFPL
ncbi:hypothetical protein Esti_003845 [Eimeria stiedai]